MGCINVCLDIKGGGGRLWGEASAGYLPGSNEVKVCGERS